MNFLQWNLNGYSTRLEELEILINAYNPTVLFLQETHFHPQQTATLQGYNVFTSNAACPPGANASGGAAIFIKDYLHAEQLTLNFPYQAVAVRTVLSYPIVLCSVYIPPHRSHTRVTRKDLKSLINSLQSNFIVGTDLNGHSPLWDSSRISSDYRGKEFEALL